MNMSAPSSPFLPLPEEIGILSVCSYPTELVVHIACHVLFARCPCCGTRSERIHGHYRRTVADLPCGGRRVILSLTVRKFVCAESSCFQQIFTERLTALVQPYARMTNRLREALIALGLATSAQVVERTAPRLAMSVSAPTLLRRLREVTCPPPKTVRILGVDDWAWKKGQTYGTLLVDLEVRKPIELLADRKEETLTAWLLLHPEIQVISRDRGGEYAAAARKGAPQAQQIADKFHLIKNLRDGLKDLMARKQKVLPEVEESASDGIPLRARRKQQEDPGAKITQEHSYQKRWRSMGQGPRQSSVETSRQTRAQARSQISRTNRIARYEAVRALHQQLVSERAIARRLHLSRKTVHTFLVAETFPERCSRPAKSSILDPYKPSILDRWKAGCWNGSQILAEVRQLGYRGSDALFRLFLSSVRKSQKPSRICAGLALGRQWLDGACS